MNLADASNVKLTGNQTISGTKTFSGTIQVDGANNIVLSATDLTATLQESLNAKQDKLTAGDNISIDSATNTISANIPDYVFGQVLFGGTITKIGNQVATATITSKLKEKLGVELSTIEVLPLATGSVEGSYGYSQLDGVYFIVNVDEKFAELNFNKGDWLISIGTAWSKVDNTDAVTSVNNKLGAITVNATTSHIKATLSDTDLTSSSLSYLSNVSCDQKFITTGLSSANLTGTTTFATAGVTASVANELLAFASASTKTVKLETTSATPADVEISCTTATKSVVTGWSSTPSVTLSLDATSTSAPQVATGVIVTN